MNALPCRRNETRGDCPACGYKNSYIETIGKHGRIGWCSSCEDRKAIAAHLRGSGGDTNPTLVTTTQDTETAIQRRQESLDRALAIWNGASPATQNDPAGKYLARRGLPHLTGSPALRYRADLAHPDKHRYMGLVGLVQGAADKPLGVHRTYLTRDGHKAAVEPQKASKGPIWGGAIRLQPAMPEITIGEGIETSASAGLLLGLPAWAAISAGNLAAGLKLPPEVRRIVIAADDDGINKHGQNPGIEAAEAAARRWMAEGRRVRIFKPDTPRIDFNDLLLACRVDGRVA